MNNPDKKPLVVLKNINPGPYFGTCFYSSVNPENPHEDHTKLFDDTVAYEVVGFVDTDDQAQALIDKTCGPFHFHDYLTRMTKELHEKAKKAGVHDICPDPKALADQLHDLCGRPNDLKRS